MDIINQILKLANVFYKLSGWDDYIRGEWWIDLDYGAEYADQDVGESGHETIAIDNLLNKDLLLDYLKEYYAQEIENKEDLQQELDRLEEYSSDDYGSSTIYFNEIVPDSVGVQLVGQELWADIKKDVRMAYAKHRGAIMVINSNFYAWTISKRTISVMQDFLWEIFSHSEEEIKGEMTIEEGKSSQHRTMSISDFLQIKQPGEIWRHA